MRGAPLWLLIAGVSVLGGALAFQYLGGLRPCVLCLYQRWPWGVVIALAALALVAHRAPAVRAGLVMLAGLTLWVGAAIAGFHVGVEQGWWQGTAECGAQALNLDDVAALTDQLMATPLVRCDEVAWQMLGISMAGYNAIISIGLGGLALYAGARLAIRR